MKILSLLLLSIVVCLAIGCREGSHSHSGDGDHTHDETSAHEPDDHAPPHGGTPVLVADDEFHLELLLDRASGTLQAYVLDGHLESYVAVPETGFVLVANLDGKREELRFQRLPEPGQTTVPERSARFEAQAEWLKTTREFEGRIPTITLNGKHFADIAFQFPKGTRHVH